ncbi:hypothetical protein AALO_G00250060 [Alosa alosa]|uniref:CCHC-type domain-containing protein n=1 Tax=Alosa alosa TaxID=278164 RepID=A0AAV6G0H4_9TELE|nr:hypothetical protein AALO_G00250060 [Alosa alosa]
MTGSPKELEHFTETLKGTIPQKRLRSICKDETHSVVKCPTFAAKSLEDKKAFIRENNLCYGCLRKGHNSKDCKTRHTCGTCSRRHPTCLREERENRSAEAKEKQSTSTDKCTSQEEIKVTSHAVTQRVFATSSIVPVFMSSANEPQKEVITYALLDTQSDSTFVLEDLLEELNVETKPVQLKLSTMTAVDTPIASKSVYGLQIRGLQSEKQIQLVLTLLTGPDLINSLFGVLCRFRKEAVAIICDIEKMFHQFYASPELRNYLRFLWWEDGDLEAEPQEYQMAFHLFGATSSPGCANFGLKYLAHQYKEEYPSASAFVERNFYVNDGLISVPSVEKAKELIAETRELCKRGGLRLHKFNSNERSVLDSVDPTVRAVTSEPLNLDLNAAPAERALGIQWSLEHDTFSFNVNPQTKPSTRRGILSIIASLYDPVGFVAPFILQELCRRGIGWDDPLPEDLSPRWERWKSNLQRLKEVSIPRCYQPQGFCNTVTRELHHFSDASNIGYGSCSYLRSKNEDGEVHCSLVMAKARVAPTKLTSIHKHWNFQQQWSLQDQVSC